MAKTLYRCVLNLGFLVGQAYRLDARFDNISFDCCNKNKLISKIDCQNTIITPIELADTNKEDRYGTENRDPDGSCINDQY